MCKYSGHMSFSSDPKDRKYGEHCMFPPNDLPYSFLIPFRVPLGAMFHDDFIQDLQERIGHD
jgi:hypothetical protein